MTMRILAAVAVIAFCASELSAAVWIHPNRRTSNYGGGSCVYATATTQLCQAGAPNLARYVRRNYRGGEWHADWNRTLNHWGVATRSTFQGDKKTLDFAHVNRLTANISYHPNHACLFLGWYVNHGRITHAYVLNPNHTGKIETPTYREFMRNWRENDGDAIVVVPKRRTSR